MHSGTRRFALLALALTIVTLLLGVAEDAQAQGCSMCGSTLKGEDDPLARSLSRSVVLMASMPFALFLTVAGWLAWRIRRGRTGAETEESDE